MTKQHIKHAVIFLFLTLILYFLVIPPLFCRGTVHILFQNKLSYPFTVVSVNEQEVGQVVQPGATLRVRYDIKYEGDLSAILNKSDTLRESNVQIAGYIEPACYGNADVTVFLNDSYAEEIKVTENIHF